MTQVELSIVATLYRSADFVDAFLERAVAAAASLTESFELIIVNDGSPDDSLERALAHVSRDNRITVLELSRNFGHHQAILAGLDYSRGALVFLVDSDLEEPPELLLQFWDLLRDEQLDVVYGRHLQNTGGRARRITSSLYWRFFKMLAEVDLEQNICMVRLMRRRYVDALLGLGELNVFLGGMFAWVGFRQRSVVIERTLRRARSTYSPLGRISLFARSIIAFSVKPLYAVFFLGMAVSVVALLSAVALVAQKLISPDTILSGFTSLFVSLWFIGGLVIAMLGLVGLYVGQVYQETKQRPRYIIRRVHESARDGTPR